MMVNRAKCERNFEQSVFIAENIFFRKLTRQESNPSGYIYCTEVVPTLQSIQSTVSDEETLYFTTFKNHVFCTDGKISVRINLPLFSTVVHLLYVCFCPVGLLLL